MPRVKPGVEKKKPGPKPGTGGGPRIPLPEDVYNQVQTMGALGLTRKMIALILNMSEDTLARRLAEDPELVRRLETGQALAGAEVATCLYNLATGKIKMIEPDGTKVYLTPPNLGAIIWYEKTRGGRSERFKDRDEDDVPLGEAPRIPLATLQAAVKAAEEAQKNGKRFKFGKRAIAQQEEQV